MGLPSKLKNCNLFIDGTSHIGEIPSVTLCKLAIKTEGYRGGGMLGEIDIDVGLDKLEAEFSAGGVITDALKQFGAVAHDAAMLRFAGAYQAETGGSVVAVQAVMRGRYTEIDWGEAKVGGDTEHKHKMGCTYYRLTIDGQDIVEIDLVAGIYIVNGVDRYAEIRAAISS